MNGFDPLAPSPRASNAPPAVRPGVSVKKARDASRLLPATAKSSVTPLSQAGHEREKKVRRTTRVAPKLRPLGNSAGDEARHEPDARRFVGVDSGCGFNTGTAQFAETAGEFLQAVWKRGRERDNAVRRVEAALRMPDTDRSEAVARVLSQAKARDIADASVELRALERRSRVALTVRVKGEAYPA